MIEVPKDCRACGACCANPMDPKWIEVTEEDAVQIPLELFQAGDIERYAMKQDGLGVCVALLGAVGVYCECSMYDDRPSICRRIQLGGCVLRL